MVKTPVTAPPTAWLFFSMLMLIFWLGCWLSVFSLFWQPLDQTGFIKTIGIFFYDIRSMFDVL